MLELIQLNKYYRDYYDFHALKDINLTFKKGEMVAILGESGSGKSTLLNVMSGLDKYDSGDIKINGQSTKHFNKQNWAMYRNNYVGFVFQEYNLIDHLTLVENVELPLLLQGKPNKEAREKAIEKCELLGLKNHMHKVPAKVSGGQQQRAAIARSLVADPLVIMADEPTGALDSENSEIILSILRRLAEEHIVILVTHDEEYAYEYADRIVRLEDGRVISDEYIKEVDLQNEKTKSDTLTLIKPRMKFKILRKFAANNLKKRKLRTFFTAMTMSIGLIAIFLIMFLINGIRSEVTSFVREYIPENQYIVTPERRAVELSEEKLKFVRDLSMVNEAYYAKEIEPLSMTDYFEHNGERFYYPEDNFTLYNIPKNSLNFNARHHLVGKYPTKPNEVIITSRVAADLLTFEIKTEELEYALERIENRNLTLTVDRISHFADEALNDQLTIVGIVPSQQANVYALDEKMEYYASLVTDKDNDLMRQLGRHVHIDKQEVQVFLTDERDSTIESLDKILRNEELLLQNPTEIVYGSIDRFFDTVLYILVGTASVSLIVSGILVGLIVYISVIERVKEIGILNSLGAKAGNIRTLINFESGFIGFLSSLIALIIALLIGMLINRIFHNTIGALMRSLNITIFDQFNLLKVNWLVVIAVLLISVIYAVICGLIPAFKASRLHAVEALRQE